MKKKFQSLTGIQRAMLGYASIVILFWLDSLFEQSFCF